MRLTRRELAALMAAAPAAVRTPEPQQPAAPAAAETAQSAADDLRKSVAAIRKLSVATEYEPAFSFRPQ